MSKLYPKLQTGGNIPNKGQKTILTQGQQLAYEKWKSDNKYTESDDYDLAGYWKEEGMKRLQFPNLSPIEKIKEIESQKGTDLDDFYKRNLHVAGMNHTPGEVSKNPYSKIPSKNLNYVLELEKMRDIMTNDKGSPKPKYRITREQKDFFRNTKDNDPNSIDYIDTPKQIQRETIASRIFVGDEMGNSKYTKNQNQFVHNLAQYAFTKPNHLPDKFKRLAPFSNGDGYMQISEESKYSGNPSYNISDKNGNPLNTSFDKRGQGFWNNGKFIAYQQGGTLSQLGYKRHSPYNKASSLLIHTPTGSITMKEVDHPILGIGHNEIKFMLPNQEYQFKSNQVLEIPMKSLYPKGQNGMKIPKLNSLQKDSLDLYNYYLLQRKLEGSSPLPSKESRKSFMETVSGGNELNYGWAREGQFNHRKQESLELLKDPNTKRRNDEKQIHFQKDPGMFKTNISLQERFEINKKLQTLGDSLVKNNKNIAYENFSNSPDITHKTIEPSDTYKGLALNYAYKKPSFYDEYYKEKDKKPISKNNVMVTHSLKSIKLTTPQKTTKNRIVQETQKPIVERMSEMTPVQTIQPQVQDTLVQRPITMKTIYPSKPHVWNTSVPKRHSVERAPGLGGYNRIYQEGGQAPEMSPEQQQEIVRRVRNLRKKLPKMGVAYDPISFRHAMYVNKKAFDKEDQELLGAFDEDTMVKLMNNVPDDDQPTYKKGGSIKGKSKMYPKCKCGCGGVSVGKNKMFQNGGMTPTDSLRHQASKIMDYEALRGSQYGTGLPNYGNPQIQSGDKQGAINYFMNSVAPRVSHFKSAMEKGEAGDFVYNTGRDPRIYMLDQFIKSKGNQQGLPNRGSYNLDIKSPEWGNKKQEFETEWSKYSNDIQNLPENQRRVLLNKGRDFYYQNIDKQNGQPNPAYKNTWYGRIWNTNDFKPFNPSNPNFSPKYQQGGTMDVLDENGESQMKIVGGERIFSRIATKKMLQLNEEGNYKELGKFICDELYSQDKREPQYVKE